MNTYFIGPSGSGKTIKMKRELFKNLRRGIPTIYLNFSNASSEFSQELLAEAKIVNANSFTQISKLKKMESHSLIIVNLTRNISELATKSKLAMIKTLLTNPNFKDTSIFIDESYSLQVDREIYSLILEFKGDFFMTGQCVADLIIYKDSTFQNKYLSKDFTVDLSLSSGNHERYFGEIKELLMLFNIEGIDPTQFNYNGIEAGDSLEFGSGSMVKKNYILLDLFDISYSQADFVERTEQIILDSIN